MPIEIRELIIKTSISEPGGEKQQEKGRPAQDREDIVAECVEQVMAILRDREER